MLNRLLAVIIGSSFVFNCSHPPRESANPPKVLFLGLDGIGYTQFKKMQDGGYFRAFRGVSPMVASFPSISDTNWAMIMRTPVEPSFTREHFDQSLQNGEGAMTGGLMDHVLHPPVYETYFDFRPEGAVQHLASMTYSETTALYWLDSLEKQLFQTTDKKIFKAFIVSTDFMSHTKGEKTILRYLSELDKKVEQLRARYRETFGKDLEVILVSDHGNAFLKPKPVEVQKALQQDGWKLNSSLTSDKDVVLVIPEILSFAPFFTKKGQEAALAKTISRAEGLEFAVYSSGKDSSGRDQLDVLSHGGQDHGRATIDGKAKTLTYKVLKGQDPFDHLKFFKKTSLSFNRYFQETLKDEYPNALVRAWEGLTQMTIQKPSILASPQLGYVFSNRTLELLTKLTGLESVHGSFHREESLGIFVSTDRDLPPVYPSAVLDFVK